MILESILIFVSIPVGYLIAWLARDELIIGRKWFKILMLISVIGIIAAYIFKEKVILFSFLFILIVSFISFRKSKDKKWTRKAI